MRLRTQLGLFFTVMAGIILALGALAVWGGSQVVTTFSKSLLDMEKVSQVRSLQVLLARQKASLDSYFLVGEPQELERFEEMSALVVSRLKQVETASPSDPLIRSLGEQYGGVLESARAVIALYASDKNAAFARATDDLLPQVRRFFDRVNAAEAQIADEVQQAQGRVKDLVVRGGRLVLVFGFAGAFAGFFFALLTFRSLTRSLKLLQEGAAAFGGGQWDFRINLPAKNELGELARSFNEMANNVKQLEMQTVHMHRMSAVGQLAGGVAHEINNPLTGVLGQAQLLLDKLPADDPRRSHIEKIERAAVRCKRIVRSLLDFSRQKEAQFAAVDINESLEATLDFCEPDLQSSHVTVLKNFGASVPRITGNSSQLQQVFLNIVTNGLQAMPKGGTLTISSRLTRFVPPGGQGKPAEGVEVSFTDTGVGIAREHLSHVFEPFFTTKEIGKGTGLGLSVSLGIVKNHGGDIQAESRGAGGGATFRVLLPLVPPGSTAQTPEPVIPSAVAGGEAARFGPGTHTRY
jgi:signal transduction histidine kinase